MQIKQKHKSSNKRSSKALESQTIQIQSQIQNNLSSPASDLCIKSTQSDLSPSSRAKYKSPTSLQFCLSSGMSKSPISQPFCCTTNPYTVGVFLLFSFLIDVLCALSLFLVTIADMFRVFIGCHGGWSGESRRWESRKRR